MTSTTDAIAYIERSADSLREQSSACDELGRLTDEVAGILRDSGGMRLLQASSHGGHEADPREFFEWVRSVARLNPSAGWVGGVLRASKL